MYLSSKVSTDFLKYSPGLVNKIRKTRFVSKVIMKLYKGLSVSVYIIPQTMKSGHFLFPVETSQSTVSTNCQ